MGKVNTLGMNQQPYRASLPRKLNDVTKSSKMASASSSSGIKCYDFVAKVDGLGRIIRGVHLDTTCNEIVSVLSRATGRKRPQVLVEVWQGCMRRVAPYERPLLLWAQWGRHKKQVSFALRDASFFSPSAKKRVRGYPIRHKALHRANKNMKKFKCLVQHRVEKAKRVSSLLSRIPGGAEEREKKEGEVMEMLLESLGQKEADLKKKRARLSTLEQVQARRQREWGGGRGTYEERSQQISNAISRLEQELSLRNNLYRLQSSKVGPWVGGWGGCMVRGMSHIGEQRFLVARQSQLPVSLLKCF